MNTEKEIALFIDMTHNKFKMASGILVAVPVPEKAGSDKSKIKEAIPIALADMKKEGIQGNQITLFLKKPNELTKGESCETNVELIINNAKRGALICKELFTITK